MAARGVRHDVLRIGMVATLVIACVVGAALAQGASQYELVIIEAFNGSIPECYIYDINDFGTACGSSTYDGFYSGFVWDREAGKSPIPIIWAEDINNADQIVGDAILHDVATGNSIVIPAFSGNYPTVYLHGLNDNGLVVGHVKGIGSDSDGVNRTPIIWDSENGSRGIAVPAARELLRVNNNGLAVGNIRWSAGDSEAFVYNVLTGEDTNLHDLLSPSGLGTSSASGINENGVVTGEGWNGSIYAAFTWAQDVGFTFLPGLNGGETGRVHPRAINAMEQVVGSAMDGSNRWRAFIWDSQEGMRDLNDAVNGADGFILDWANAISDDGWIAGYGHYGPGWGAPVGFVLIPSGSASAPTVDSKPDGLMLRLAPGSANPSSGRLGLEFTLAVPSTVRMSVFDAQGRRIDTLLNEARTAGVHRITWNGSSETGLETTAGVYYVRLWSPLGTSQIRVVRVK